MLTRCVEDEKHENQDGKVDVKIASTKTARGGSGSFKPVLASLEAQSFQSLVASRSKQVLGVTVLTWCRQARRITDWSLCC